MKSERDELLPLDELRLDEVPAGVDRRAFMMRTALIGATAVLTGGELFVWLTSIYGGTPTQMPPRSGMM